MPCCNVLPTSNETIVWWDEDHETEFKAAISTQVFSSLLLIFADGQVRVPSYMCIYTHITCFSHVGFSIPLVEFENVHWITWGLLNNRPSRSAKCGGGGEGRRDCNESWSSWSWRLGGERIIVGSYSQTIRVRVSDFIPQWLGKYASPMDC